MAIALFSGVVGRRCTIRPKALDSWTVTPNLWGAIVAPPGFMKTPIFKELRKATNQIETILKKENKEAFCKYETDKMEHAILKKAAQDSFKKKRSDPSTQDNNHLIDPAVLMEPTAPPNKYLVVNDTSSEKLATLLKDNPKGLILYRDELSGLLLSFEKQGRESDRAFYLETWDGSSSFSVHRIGRGDTQIENMCLSIIGGIQPEPLEQYFYKTLSAGTGDDGLLSRFQLLIYPECRKPTYVDCHPNLDALKTVIEIFKMVYETSFSSSGFLQDDDGPPFIRFDNDAQNFFKSWFESNCELTSSDSGNSSALIAHFTKYKKLMPALSLLFYIIDQLHKGSPARFSTIPLSCAQRAASWCSCLESHAKKIYGGLVKPELKIAHALASKILNGQLTSGLTVKDIYRRHWSGLTDRKLIYLGLDVLSEHKWLKLVQPESTGGRKASPTVIINPQLTKEGSNEESDTAT
jgi:putative DNA primase/helicase